MHARTFSSEHTKWKKTGQEKQTSSQPCRCLHFVEQVILQFWENMRKTKTTSDLCILTILNGEFGCFQGNPVKVGLPDLTERQVAYPTLTTK